MNYDLNSVLAMVEYHLLHDTGDIENEELDKAITAIKTARRNVEQAQE
jgi:hypothetical protein